MRNLFLAAACWAVVTSCGGAAGPGGLPGTPETRATVMTRNLYIGTELDEAIQAVLLGDPEAIVAAVGAAWARVLMTDFETRAKALAQEIAEAGADLVGLQEAALWRTQFPADSVGPDPTPATDVAYDFVQLLLDELALLGQEYEVAAEFRGLDVEFPGLTPSFELMDVRLTDREVILAKVGGPVTWSNPQTGAFQVNLPITEGIEVTRGWASVDAVVTGPWGIREKPFRFVTTHLDADHPDVRMAQAAEILQGPTATNLPVVLVGDFNYDVNGDDPGAQWFRGAAGDAGFELVAPAIAGTGTCCSDELLQDPTVVHDERLDLILCRGDMDVQGERVHGGEAADMIEGLWPSDHAGVSCELTLE